MIPASPPRRRRAARIAAIPLSVTLAAVVGATGQEIGPLAPSPAGPGAPGSPPPGGTWIRPGTALNPGATIPAGFDRVIIAPPPALRPSFWVVHTRDCPQVLGSDPWPGLKALQFDDRGRLIGRDPAALLAQTVGRPVLVVVQGNLTTPPIAVNGGHWTHSWLLRHGALAPEAVVVAFDWPSQRVYPFPLEPCDNDEKLRRAYVAGDHLARFLLAFPPASRVCLLGQSAGGRVVPAALHLLGGGELTIHDHPPSARLPVVRPDLHLRAVVIAGASDRHWLDPGQRLGRALAGCEAVLNLYNRHDAVLAIYPTQRRTDHRHALGRVGLLDHDLQRLGPLSIRYAERDLHPLLGREHTLLGAVAHPQIACWIAPYTWARQWDASPR